MKHRTFLFLVVHFCCLLLILRNRQQPLNAQIERDDNSPVLIDAIYYDGYGYFDADEAIALRNTSDQSVNIGGWQLADGNASIVTIPDDIQIKPLGVSWLTGDAGTFQQQFGFAPDVKLDGWPGYANSGDEVLLYNRHGEPVDVVVYGDGNTAILGWHGTAVVQPYAVRSVFGREGQVLYRKLEPGSGLSLPDTDRAVDWAQDRSSILTGRKVRYPGWDLEEFYFPVREEQPATLRISVAPDNAYETIVQTINDAQDSIKIATLTIENLAVGDALVGAAKRGVSVQMLMEGGPVGGIDSHEKAICQKLEDAGGQCWFMINDTKQRIHDRYRYMHAKYMIVDGKLALVGSENLSPNSMPYDEKTDGTWGRRGVILITDAARIVEALETMFMRDLDPNNHQDILRWQAEHPLYGSPPSAYTPIQNSGGITYTVRYPSAAPFSDASYFELQQTPENILRYNDGILGLLSQAGKGDILLVQQLQERPYWGASNSNPVDDPNIRLEALIGAARRGATVRILLDEFFDVPGSLVSNAATCQRLRELAKQEILRLQCQQANPAGLGIHNKMILAHIGGRGYLQIGSWNGTELASKGNREVALLVQSDTAYHYLAEMFEQDWPHLVFFPLLVIGYRGPAEHALISEVVYDPYGPDEAEFIEIVNPTGKPINLSSYSIGDAVARDDFEDVRRFPEGALVDSGEVVVVTTSAIDFFDSYDKWPDYEILDTSSNVANLIDDPSWGDTATFLRLGNQGDEVILRDQSDEVIDVLAYGTGAFPGYISCPLLIGTNHSLERIPYWIDTKDCSKDFRDWPYPSPGQTP